MSDLEKAPQLWSDALTARKANDVQSTHGYHYSGYVLTNDNGNVAIVDKGAVRWLSKDQFWNLLHQNECTDLAVKLLFEAKNMWKDRAYAAGWGPEWEE